MNIRDWNRVMNGPVYEVIMACLAVVVGVIAIIELTQDLNPAQERAYLLIDYVILTVFAADYFYRLARAPDRWAFVKGHVIELLAIMPLGKQFRLFRLFRILRMFVFTRRMWLTVRGVFRTNGLIYALLITLGIMVAAAFSVMYFEPEMDSFGEALWWTLVTITTVGYGDIAPDSPGGRITAAVLMVTGIGMIGMVTGSIATYFVGRIAEKPDPDPPTSVAREQLEYVKAKLDELDQLSEEDVRGLNRLVRELWQESRRPEQAGESILWPAPEPYSGGTPEGNEGPDAKHCR